MKHFNKETFNTIIHLLAPHLVRFVKVKDGLYNFRCPICGDSQKNSFKRRAYIYSKGDTYNFYCHNCLYSVSLYNFVKTHFPFILQSLNLSQVFFNNIQAKADLVWEKKKKPPNITMHNVQTLPENHIALQYIKQRKIPKSKWDIIYYSDNLTNELQCPFNKGLLFKECDSLLVARNLDFTSKKRYFIQRDDENALFNIKTLKTQNQVIIVEGLIDSLFLNNAIPSLNSNLISTSYNLMHNFNVKKSDIILVWDNEPFNRNIVSNMQKAIMDNFKVFIPPKGLECKDINEMVLSGVEQNEIINNSAYLGIEAKMKFNLWKRV